ncbi:hypothetical protein BE20_40020 [Sorangium cellulosum]|uniref:Uncharacterized protein n=1 Tax=Sorangium cellulosum TaxID=56 RepID=A0A150SXM6_SORCE|nr:hypothetical protein BE18_25545 [Sorangium cellulosum]KYF97048.1 hypothetical protein BE20_40020 [Sorangium cellulosum]
MTTLSIDKSTAHGNVGVLALAFALSACLGNLGGVDGAPPGEGTNGTSGSSSGGGPGTVTPGEALECDASVVDPGPSPMRLLSREQYLNTVRDLVGDVPGLEAALGPANEASAFGLVQPDVTQVELEHFQAAADVIAAAIASDPARLGDIAPCEAGAEPRACARQVVVRFGARAYRAPITDAADIERHLGLFGVGAETSYEHGIEMLLRGMLQSPRFLYRVEIGTSEKVSERAVRLSPHEVAARLSYTLWGTLPDARLNEAIEDGGLTTREGVAAQVGWMLEDERGKKLLHRFLGSWTHLNGLVGVVKDESAFPEWQSRSFRESLRGQADAFFDHVLHEQGGALRALFTSTTVFYNKDLGGYYGVTGGDAFQALERADGTASGILTLPALLAVQAKPAESSPIYRGRFVREALLCQQLPAPPANIPKPPEVDASSSTRERLAQHEVDPSCSGCHQLLDPIGFGFEHYDALGRYRELDGGKPVDASGKVVATRDMNGQFVGVAELGERLAGSAEVEECVARQWFRFAIARFEQDMDGCSMERLLETFRAAGQDLNALPRAVVETDAFLYRRPIDTHADAKEMP